MLCKKRSNGMAKQDSTQPITGTIDAICFYQMEGKYYARQKSSLAGKRVKLDPAFAATMRHANFLAKASVMAKTIYTDVPASIKNRKLYQQLTGKAMRLLQAGGSEEECYNSLRAFTESLTSE
jgi:hypothetical protein